MKTIFPAGIYIMKSVSEEEYIKRYQKIHNKPFMLNLPREKKDANYNRNLANCSKTFKINRKKMKVLDNYPLGNFICNPDASNYMLAGILIAEVIPEKEARDLYPEYFL